MNVATSLHIRWMVRRDMPQVLDIESRSFDHPWCEDDFIRCLRQRNCIGMVIEHGDDNIVGFMIYELYKHELRILNFAVRPDCRRRGVGRQLVEKLRDKLSYQRRNRIAIDVRAGNLAAQLFFRSCGFRATNVYRDWYEDESPPEDAYHFVYRYTE